jgi:hypothetical protein
VTKGGANLLAVAKLFFRLSKTPANDAVLRGEGVCECVVTALRAGGRLESVLGGCGCGCVGVGVGLCCEERACVNAWCVQYGRAGASSLCSVCGGMRYVDDIYWFRGLDWAIVRCIRFHVGASSSGFS